MKIKLPWLLLLSLLGTSVLAQTNNYCTASANSNYYTVTDKIILGSINNNPTAGYTQYPGYTDHTNLSTDVAVGGTLPFSISVGRYSFPNSYFKIFADFNGDGIFSANELAYAKGPTPDTTVSGNITIPESATVGKTRIRVIQSPSDFNDACGKVANNGEVDDYSLNITKASYCTATINYTYYAGISNVTFGQINNSNPNTPTGSNPYPAYGDFTALSTTANPGDVIPISVTSAAPPGATSYIAVYTDFNNNGIFEDSELSLSTSWKALDNFTSKTVNGIINVPGTATSGNVRVRVIQAFEPIKKPCGNLGNNGEVEEYTLIIQCKVPKPSANSVNYCAPSNTTLWVNNPVTGLKYSWHSNLAGGIQLGSGTSYSTFANTSTTVYLQAQNIQGCLSERAPVTIGVNPCCSTASYSLQSSYKFNQPSDGNLTVKITNKQSTTQTLTVSMPQFNSSNILTNGPVTVGPNQTITLTFYGAMPTSGNIAYSPMITIKDGKCTLIYAIAPS